MSIEMMGVLEAQCASLGRQVRELAAENERVLKLLTEFVGRVDALEAALARTEANRDALLAALQQVLHHCRNTGRGSEMVDARIIERCEDTAAAALEGRT